MPSAQAIGTPFKGRPILAREVPDGLLVEGKWVPLRAEQAAILALSHTIQTTAGMASSPSVEHCCSC